MSKQVASDEQEPNPFTCKKVLTKFEQQAFNFAVKVLVESSEPVISKGEAYKQVSNQWSNELYRKQQTSDYLNDRLYKVESQMGQLEQCLEALDLNL